MKKKGELDEKSKCKQKTYAIWFCQKPNLWLYICQGIIIQDHPFQHGFKKLLRTQLLFRTID